MHPFLVARSDFYMLAQSKITEFDVTVSPDKQVVRFQISVSITFLVDVVKTFDGLPEE